VELYVGHSFIGTRQYTKVSEDEFRAVIRAIDTTFYYRGARGALWPVCAAFTIV
jgi:hypothetical protein